MRYFLLYLAYAGTSVAHSTFQGFHVKGVAVGLHKGIREPKSNSPVMEFTSDKIICNDVKEPLPTDIITVAAGDPVSAEWHHENGPKQGDADEPIAPSHKGSHTVYLAKIDKATNPVVTGLSWFKIAEDGLKDGKWATERMAAKKGLVDFEIPPCIAPGDYLLRAEIIALHEANRPNGAQPYMECAQITVTGSGTVSPPGSPNPGLWKATDPGISVDIYNGIKNYTIPGPALFTCDGKSGGTTSSTTSTTTSTTTSGNGGNNNINYDPEKGKNSTLASVGGGGGGNSNNNNNNTNNNNSENGRTTTSTTSSENNKNNSTSGNGGKGGKGVDGEKNGEKGKEDKSDKKAVLAELEKIDKELSAIKQQMLTKRFARGLRDLD